ncbi:TPA: PTS-dependent dihydroxyacetone kinase phosphotransferase subunit DhaM [Providencia stuartii]|uniref:dihydroxyacetone kinase phosphoryl donor subunit DhaM n=1 Tax=Providencia stuartii TaxID=588 RepID=UPI000538A389|nr:dihydroxyacetone kinase phosphoryl donor subunit DhaM [Providencia stuartii]AXO18310.1 HPr family phosphocarrier protein [Providencia stuartii]MBN5590849.1 PTS-dependent dihydroxyacetone kinase phosphotransferase subunit DhaM [Providencia stuartii]HEM6905114.1 PTS-dependent dihydroxyacetone kinase phosphotransferase subunit DhaM [Providencia stuartii]HEM6908504.1 PTS-dependent dihydroxyacetone kinase phosphotransferase subunit DhaM [Providencia stuartii]HEM7152187.1 PTS-dependent dihydroxya
MIGLIIVSHSKLLADGLHQLAAQMQNKQKCHIITAAGVDDETHPIGTDAVKVMEAIESLSDAEHIILLMDLGSALLSAETALDLIDPDLAEKVHLCSAPLVEGAIAITAATSGGASIDEILNEAQQALQAKQQQLNDTVTTTENEKDKHTHFSEQALTTQWVVKNPSGLHIRPAAKLATLLSGFTATLELRHGEKRADAKSMNQIALLQVRQGDKITLVAEGVDSQNAIDAFNQLAQHNFGDNIATTDSKTFVGKTAYVPTVAGLAHHHAPNTEPCISSYQTSENETRRATKAIEQLKTHLDSLANTLSEQYGEEIANIFRGHRLLLEDDELVESITQSIENERNTAYDAISNIFNNMSKQYQQLDDEYLQARFIDIEDLKNQLLMSISSVAQPSCAFTEPTIILSGNLGPSELLRYRNTNVVGVALANGSPYSHTCIIAAKMGLSILTDLGDNIHQIAEQTKLQLSIETRSLIVAS